MTARDELPSCATCCGRGSTKFADSSSTCGRRHVEVGLGQGITAAAAEFSNRTGIPVEVDVPGSTPGSHADAKASVLRIIQEALQNVRKHAAASDVSISLDGDRLAIADNGRGFDVMRLASGATRNFGLQFMRQRAELMGSSLQIESRQGEGTRILIRLPGSSTHKEES